MRHRHAFSYLSISAHPITQNSTTVFKTTRAVWTIHRDGGKLITPFVFIAVAFFAWIWSVVGMIVPVPILIVAKIVLDEFEATRKIGAFLGDL